MKLFGQREKFNQPTNPNPASPAERAAAVWDRRIGSAVVQAYNWRRISLGLIVTCIVLAGGLVWQSMKTTVVPYVVTVNETTGEIKKAGAFVEADYTPQEPEIKYFIAEFVKNARSIGYDPVVYANQQTKAMAYMTQNAAQKYKNKYSDQQSKVGKTTIAVKDLSVQKVPESESTFLVRWTEEEVDIRSASFRDIPMSGTFSYTMLPVEEDNILNNPLGIYITGFDFIQDVSNVNNNNQQQKIQSSNNQNQQTK